MPTPTASAVALDPGDPMLIDGVTSGNVSRARDGGGGGGEEGGGGGGGPPGTLAAASSPVAAQGAPAGGGDATGGSAANPPSPQPLRSPDVGPPPPGGSLLGRGGLAAGPPGADGLALPRRDAMSLEPPTAVPAVADGVAGDGIGGGGGEWVDGGVGSPAAAAASAAAAAAAAGTSGGDGTPVAAGRRACAALSPAAHAVVVRARRQIAAFLKAHRADEVVPDESLVVIVERGLVLKRAFLALREHGIRAASVLDSREDKLVGVITVSDFMKVFCHLYETDPDGEPNVALSHMTIAQWKAITARGRGHDEPRPSLVCAHADESLYDACCTLRDQRVHRLPIVDAPSNGSLMMLNHWIVLRFVYEHLQPRSRSRTRGGAEGGLAAGAARGGDAGSEVGPPRPGGASPRSGTDGLNGVGGRGRRDGMEDASAAGGEGGPNGGAPSHATGDGSGGPSGHVSDLFDLTVSALGLGTFGAILSVTDATPLVTVLQLLSEQRLSAVPVVTADGLLVNVFARVDVRELATDDRAPLNLRERLGDVLRRLRPAGFAVATCAPTDSVRALFSRFDAARKHRLYCVDGEGRLRGVVSLSDVLRYFLD